MSETTARVASTSEAEPTRQSPAYQPRFDIVETENELTLYGDLPGVDEQGLDIRYEDEQLMIHGKVPPRHADVPFLRQEYGVGDFQRTFRIGESIDSDQITAELKNGVLAIRLPKSQAAKPRRIEVKAS